MTRVTHIIGDRSISASGKDTSFILTNQQGSYICLGDKPQSRYQGFYYYDDDMYKIIEDIHRKGAVTEITNKLYVVERSRNKVREHFFVRPDHNSLVYETEKEQEIELVLDMRRSYDNRVWGRFYEIHDEGDCIVIKCTKKTDSREDPSHDVVETVLYLAVRGAKSFEKMDKWINRTYSDDKRRKSEPYSRYVYSALKLRGTHFVFSVARTREKAISESSHVHENRARLTTFKHHRPRIKDKNVATAFKCAIHSLRSLRTKQGLFAGLPWFFQVWARDELVSLKALDDSSGAQSTVKRYLDNLTPIMPNKSELANVRSADALGWLFKRILDSKFKPKARDIRRLQKVVEDTVRNDASNGLAMNHHKETWMDSLDRNGARIEIQAMHLLIFRSMYKFTKKKKYLDAEKNLKKNVLKNFWVGRYLTDGANDKAIRPNVFIAYYLYPSLLSRSQWISCFNATLRVCFLPWGGLSTIDKKNREFVMNHTGQDPLSYHNGDSWYWINNLAAVCMHKLDKKRYKTYINKILKASTQEILWGGTIGHHAELSSASQQKSEGCAMQAWSAAMYVELVDEIT